MSCEHIYRWIDGQFQCIECGKRVEYDIMVRDTKEV